MRELKKIYGEKIDFFYVKSFAEKVALFFNFKTNEVKNLLMIYRVYEQLKNNSYPVRQQHYSLIEMAVKNKNLKDSFFELDKISNFLKRVFINLLISV